MMFQVFLLFILKIPCIICSFLLKKYIIFNFNKQSQKSIHMCFLKHLQPLQSILTPASHNFSPEKNDSDTDYYPSHDLCFLPTNFKNMKTKLNSSHLLMNCLNLLNFNSQMMIDIEQKLKTSQSLLSPQAFNFDFPQTKNRSNIIQNQTSTENCADIQSQQNLQETTDPLAKKLFGKQQYKYKLILEDTFTDILYKERNFMLGVKLIQISTGKHQSNGNLIDIRLGVCDSNDNWIIETKEGLPFLKGKCQTQLYHGKAEFIKINPRDVSRGYSGKIVNLVVYAKPSMLKYSGESSLEQKIDPSLIEPLIIKNVSIKAKKRE